MTYIKFFFFFQAEDGIRDRDVTGVQTCALPIYELHEAAVVRVGVRGCLTGPARRVVRERDPEGAAFAGVEGMHVTGHAVRHFPLRDRARIEEGAIDDRAGGVNVATDTGRGHAQLLT